MAFAGSSGETRSEFARVLRLSEDEKGVRNAAEIISELSAQPSGLAMKQSVGVFLDERNVVLREDYESALEERFGVKPQKVCISARNKLYLFRWILQIRVLPQNLLMNGLQRNQVVKLRKLCLPVDWETAPCLTFVLQ